MAAKTKISRIRNIGIVAHIDAGKTTVTERILFYTGRSHRMGEVHDGQAIMDWMPQEQERGITITSAVTTCDWNNNEIHIIDTPGHVDFTIEVERSLRVLDGVLAVFCAVGGVEPQSEMVWHQADKYGVPKIAFINKMDRIGADYFGTINVMNDRFNSTPVPIQIPYIIDTNFAGVIDLIEQKVITWDDSTLGLSYTESDVPETYLQETREYRDKLIEVLGEYDDEIADKYLEEKEISKEEIKSAIKDATLSLKIVPVMCGTALRNKGIQPVLEAIIDFLPAPDNIPAVEGINPLTQEREKRYSNDKDPLAALSFKVMMHEGRKLNYLRIYSGKLKTGNDVFNTRTGKKEKIARLLKMHANKRERLNEAGAGDIIAVVGLKNTITGDTICDESHPIALESIEIYDSVISQAIEPKTPADHDKLTEALAKLMEEDPTVNVKYEDETAQTVISGMGELHLEIIIDRLIREYNAHVNIGKPRVVYRETIEKAVECDGIFEKELGEKKHFGHVILLLEPKEGGGEIEIINELDPDTIPQEFHKDIEQGVRDASQTGVLESYPVIDVRARIIGGSLKEGDSSNIGYRVAASTAFRNGCLKAGPILLEPIVTVTIIVPSEFMGDVIGDLSSRRGIIENTIHKGPVTEITASVPLKSMFGYSTDLRSATQGRGTFSMHFSKYGKSNVK